jgi:hypothetical protein
MAPATGWRVSLRLPRDYYVRLDSNDYSVNPAVVGRRIEVAAGPHKPPEHQHPRSTGAVRGFGGAGREHECASPPRARRRSRRPRSARSAQLIELVAQA